MIFLMFWQCLGKEGIKIMPKSMWSIIYFTWYPSTSIKINCKANDVSHDKSSLYLGQKCNIFAKPVHEYMYIVPSFSYKSNKIKTIWDNS